MKNILKLTLATALFATATMSAQLVDKTTTTDIQKVEINDQDAYTIKTVKEEVRALRFEEEDRGELNQNLKETPVMVTKTIWIDNDKDTRYDKKIRIIYQKDDDAKLDYVATSEGIMIKNDMKKTKLVTEEGLYKMDTKEISNVIITVDNLSSTK